MSNENVCYFSIGRNETNVEVERNATKAVFFDRCFDFITAAAAEQCDQICALRISIAYFYIYILGVLGYWSLITEARKKGKVTRRAFIFA